MTSTPPGAAVKVDGVDTGKRTPAELSLSRDKDVRIVLDMPGKMLTLVKKPVVKKPVRKPANKKPEMDMPSWAD